MTIGENSLHNMRGDLAMPSAQSQAWNDKFTYPEKKLILKSAGLPMCRAFDRWEVFGRKDQSSIIAAIRRWISWAKELAGVFV